MPFALGPYDIAEELGRGGMGVVYAATHRRRGLPLALKVVDQPDPGRVAAFQREMRAVAALRHPNVVEVHDLLTASDDDQRSSAGRVVAGAPILAMARASGTLPTAAPIPWEKLRDALLQILAGLAHAHARGIVHLDVKASNVLVIDGAYALADFGIAALAGRAPENANLRGTPGAMAPEQLFGRWRDYVPATDLFAVGVLGWRLAAGRPPFRRAPPALERERGLQPPPPLPPLAAVASGFDQWLTRCLQPVAADRFRCAADAAQALRSLGDVAPAPGHGWVDEDESTATLAQEVAWDVSAIIAPNVMLAASIQTAHNAEWRSVIPPHVEPAAPPEPGLGLHGVRPLALVGRDETQDALWEALTAVHADRKGRIVVLTGPAGCGKSRLAQWLVESAVEVGSAHGLVHQMASGSADPTAALVDTWFAAAGLEAEERRERISRRTSLDKGLAAALARAGRGGDVRVARAALVALLSSLDRPAVVWLDDFVWGGAALAMALLRAPVLVVATARTDDIALNPEAIVAVQNAPQTQEIDLGPLSPADSRRLLRDLLHLDADLAAQVHMRSGGNPLFAVELVGGWIARGSLREDRGGWVLRGSDALPEDLTAVWRARLEGLAPTPTERTALTRAALLGSTVIQRRWRLACTDLDIEVDELASRIASAGLGTSQPQGWTFGHPMLREALIPGDECRDHAACAHALVADGVSDRHPDYEALTRYLLRSDRERGLPAAITVLRRIIMSGDTSRAFTHAAEIERALRDDPTDDPWRLELALRRAQATLSAGKIAEARSLAEALSDAAVDPMVRGEALTVLAAVAIRQGRLPQAIEMAQQAWVALSAIDGADHPLVFAANAEVEALYILGRLEDAMTRGREVLECLPPSKALGLRTSLASVALQLRAPGYERDAEELLWELDASGTLHFAASLRNEMAEARRRAGDLSGAETAFRDVIGRLETLGYAGADIVRMNLAQVLIARGSIADADELLRELQARFIQQQRHGMQAASSALRAQTAANLGRWSDVEEQLHLAIELLTTTGFRHRDVTAALSGAAAACQASGHDLAKRIHAAMDALGLADRERAN